MQHESKRNSYLDEADYGFQPRSYNPSHHPSQDSSWVQPPLGPPPAQEEYDLGQQHLPPSRAYSDVGSTTTLSPDDSASMILPPSSSHPQPPFSHHPSSSLSYVPEESSYYGHEGQRPGSYYNERTGLVENAQSFAGEQEQRDRGYAHGGLEGEGDEDAWRGKGVTFGELEYANPPHLSQNRALIDQPTFTDLTWSERVLESLGIGAEKRFPVEVRIENRRRGIGRQRRPWMTWALVLSMVCVFAYELARNSQLTGSVIATKPTFNWMIGPSSSVLVNIGARFVPCMKNMTDAPLDYPVMCFNETRSTIPTNEACHISAWCNLSDDSTPAQTWRFFTPIFLHAGVVHLLLNGLVLLTAGGQIERELGSLSFSVIFFAGAVFGFEFGGNFALPGVPSVGASGGIFAVNACSLVDLGLHWKLEKRPKLKLFFLLLEFIIMVGMGFIPLLIDNFSHLGGFIMGLLLGIILYPAIDLSKRAKITVWVLRGLALVLIVLGFVLISINFTKEDSDEACQWCRYISCIPVAATNYCKGTGLAKVTTTTSSSRRSFWDL